MQDYFKPKGQAKNFRNNAGGGVTRNFPIVGVVKNNIDPTHGGRIEVYIADFGSTDPNDSSSWVTVGYMSPFFGSVQPTAPKGEKDYGSYTQNPTSYGMWFSPPDIGSTVVCIFINGDMNYGYYIGSIMDPALLQMVPAIGTNQTTSDAVFNKGEAESYGGATQVPVSNLNTNNSKITNDSGFLNAPKPVHSYSASIYFQQGLLRDPVRGPPSSSALRESPSRVGWGVSTPGRPIYQGGFTDASILKQDGSKPDSLKVIARRAGHTIVMDDGDIEGNDQSIRLRTSMGHQILMSDNGQTLFIMHSNGQSYIELGKEGTIDLYSTNSVNIRTQGDLNLHADNNININAKKDLNIAADNIKINVDNNYDWRVGKNYSGYAMGKYSVKVTGTMSMGSKGEGSYASDNTMYINGLPINLNTGSTSSPPEEVSLITKVAHTDTLSDKSKGYAAAPGLLLSIVSRAPAHSPWASAGQGVDVKVTTSASAALPAAPSDAAAAANNVAAKSPVTNPASLATLSTVPGAGAASGALTAGATAGLLGAAASAAAGTAASVVATGTGVVTNALGQVNAAVGALAQSPLQLEAAGILKPGAASVVTGLVQGGANVASAMTNNLFTGAPGAENLRSMATNVTAQMGVGVVNIQQAQTALTGLGAITGGESSATVAGLVSSATTVGVGATADFVKTAVAGGAAALAGGASAVAGGAAGAALNAVAGGAAGAAAGAAAGLLGGAGGAVASAMAAGSLGTNLATMVSGGLNSIQTSIAGMVPKLPSGLPSPESLMDQAKGIAGSAFSAITGSFKAFAPGIPQNLKSIAEKNAKDFAASAAGLPIPKLPGLSDIKIPGASSLTALAGAATAGTAIGTLAGDASSLVGAVTGAAGGAITRTLTSAIGTSAISSLVSGGGAATLASGVSNMAGGQAAISSITAASDLIPGLSGIGNAAATAATAVQNVMSTANAAASAVASLTSGGAAANLLAGAAGGAATRSLLAGAGGAAANLLAGAGGAAGLLTGSGAAGALAGALAAGKDKLSSLASAGLPPGLAAKLEAGMNALNVEGASPIKMPSVGAGTVDRSEITASIGSVLGDAKIPAPNFSGAVSAEATDAVKKLADRKEGFNKLKAELDIPLKAQRPITDAAIAKYEEAKKTLPEGDPERERLRVASMVEVDKGGAIMMANLEKLRAYNSSST